MSDKKTFVKLLFLLSKKANYELDDFEAELIADDLKEIGWEFVNASLSDFLKSMRSGDKFPSINELRAKSARIKGIPDDGSEDPRQLAEKCWSAISRFGYPNPDLAKKFVGPIGWKMIERQGGWVSFCASAGDENQKSFLIPQWTKSLEQDAERVRLQKVLGELPPGTRPLELEDPSQRERLDGLVQGLVVSKSSDEVH
jgi:hypothetical protein